MTESTYDVGPARARWTHIALRVKDIDATIDWYTKYTPMTLLDRREDADGFGAWLGMDDMTEHPFILVVAQFLEGHDPFADSPRATLAPFAHLGIEVTNKEDVDAMAERGREDGYLAMPPTMMPAPIGYICMLRDPDGNTIEYSWDQGVYTTVLDKWGSSED